MGSTKDTILKQFNNQHPDIKLTYQLFDFPQDDEVYSSKNLGFIYATYKKGTNRLILNTIYKMGTGLDRIEVNLISKVIKLIDQK
jgi:hypothetical protein